MKDGLLSVNYNDHMPIDPNGNVDNDRSQRVWMSLIGAPVAGFDTNRDAFLGPYRSYDKPLVVETGKCTNSKTYGDNGCGTMQADLDLAPGETKEILVMLGIGDSKLVGSKTVKEFGSLERAEKEFVALKKSWHSQLETLSVETPDP